MREANDFYSSAWNCALKSNRRDFNFFCKLSQVLVLYIGIKRIK